jgi:hypothetical protein
MLPQLVLLSTPPQSKRVRACFFNEQERVPGAEWANFLEQVRKVDSTPLNKETPCWKVLCEAGYPGGWGISDVNGDPALLSHECASPKDFEDGANVWHTQSCCFGTGYFDKDAFQKRVPSPVVQAAYGLVDVLVAVGHQIWAEERYHFLVPWPLRPLVKAGLKLNGKGWPRRALYLLLGVYRQMRDLALKDTSVLKWWVEVSWRLLEGSEQLQKKKSSLEVPSKEKLPAQEAIPSVPSEPASAREDSLGHSLKQKMKQSKSPTVQEGSKAKGTGDKAARFEKDAGRKKPESGGSTAAAVSGGKALAPIEAKNAQAIAQKRSKRGLDVPKVRAPDHLQEDVSKEKEHAQRTVKANSKAFLKGAQGSAEAEALGDEGQNGADATGKPVDQPVQPSPVVPDESTIEGVVQSLQLAAACIEVLRIAVKEASIDILTALADYADLSLVDCGNGKVEWDMDVAESGGLSFTASHRRQVAGSVIADARSRI